MSRYPEDLVVSMWTALHIVCLHGFVNEKEPYLSHSHLNLILLLEMMAFIRITTVIITITPPVHGSGFGGCFFSKFHSWILQHGHWWPGGMSCCAATHSNIQCSFHFLKNALKPTAAAPTAGRQRCAQYVDTFKNISWLSHSQTINTFWVRYFCNIWIPDCCAAPWPALMLRKLNLTCTWCTG